MWTQERCSKGLLIVALQVSFTQTFLKMVQEGLRTGHTSLHCAELPKSLEAHDEIAGSLTILDCAWYLMLGSWVCLLPHLVTR